MYVCVQLPAVNQGHNVRSLIQFPPHMRWFTRFLYVLCSRLNWNMMERKTLKTFSFFLISFGFFKMFFITLSNFDVSVLLWSFIFHVMFLTSGPPCFIYRLPTSVDSMLCLPSVLQHKLFKLEMLDGEILRKWRKLMSDSLNHIVNMLLSISFEICATSITKPGS